MVYKPNSNLHPNRTQVGVHTRKVPKIEYNNLNEKAYSDIGLEVPETVGQWEKRFLERVDISKGPIERSVVAMVRLKAPDYSSNEKVTTKEGMDILPGTLGRSRLERRTIESSGRTYGRGMDQTVYKAAL